MAVENTNFITGLIRATPAPQDNKKDGDDHVRLLKAVLLNCFLGFTGAVIAHGADVGSANIYVLNPQQKLLAYMVGTLVLMTPANTNGGPSTLNISGLGSRPIERIDGTPLANGDLMPGMPVLMVYDGQAFRLLSITKAYIDQLVLSGVLPGQEGKSGRPLITTSGTATFSENFGVAMNEAKGLPIPATPTLNLNSGDDTGNFTHITGTGVTINTITLPAGAARDLVIDSTGNTLAHSVSLDLPGKANIATQAGDRLTVRGDGPGKAVVVDYVRASGRAVVEQTAPGWVLLASATPAAGVSAIDFLNVFTTAYDDYEIVINDLTAASAGSLSLLVAEAGAIVTGSGIRHSANSGSDASADSSLVVGNLSGVVNGGGSSTGRGRVAGRIHVSGIQAEYRLIEQTMFLAVPVIQNDGFVGYANSRYLANALFGRRSAAAMSGFRLALSGGTFNNTGSVKIYGIRKT